MTIQKTLLLITTFVFYLPGTAQTSGSFIDERDGQTYIIVTYEITHSRDSAYKMTWMAQNLNYKTEDSYCYDDYTSNCEIMGRLYTWPAAVKACPRGWHLPNDDEWYTLANLYGGVSSAAIHLKSTSELWERGGQGTNKSLFNAMPYGNAVKGNGYYSFKGNAIFWSSSEKDEDYAWDWKLVSTWKKIQRWHGRKETIGNSVRCVRDR